MGNTPGDKDDVLLKILQENLPIIRKAAKLSQKDLASTMGISRQTVNNWETEKTFLGPTQGLAIMAIVRSLEKERPGLGRVIRALLEKEPSISESAEKPQSPLDAQIAKYISARMNAIKAEEAEGQNEDDDELTAG